MNLVRRNNGLLFPNMLDEFFKPEWFGAQDRTRFDMPAVNIKESEVGFELELAAPGLKKDDFNVEVDENILTISSEVKTENEQNDEDGRYTRKEFTFSSFKRSFTLPEIVNEDDIKASYEDGVLKLSIPKKEEALPKPKRLIEIG